VPFHGAILKICDKIVNNPPWLIPGDRPGYRGSGRPRLAPGAWDTGARPSPAAPGFGRRLLVSDSCLAQCEADR